MNTIVKDQVSLALTFVWIGFVCAISFMEAWLKFRAEGITLPIGLSIGKLIFSTLNKIEWLFAISIILSYLSSKMLVNSEGLFYYIGIPFFIVILQSFWLLPALSLRADLIISGKNVPGSNLHFYYVGFEIVKVVCLFLFGIKLFGK